MSQAQTKYLDGFRQWWGKQGHGTRSADIFCFGIRRVNDDFYQPATNRDMFEALDTAIADGSATTWLTVLVSIITSKIESTADVTLKKQYQDNRSRLKRFIEYVDELQQVSADSHVEEGDIDLSALPDGKQFYDKDSLVRIFSGRISVQDRIPKGESLPFPIRTIRSLFAAATKEKQKDLMALGIVEASGKGIDFTRWFHGWIKTMINGIRFHTVKGDYTLSQINGLLIDAKREKAWARVNGKDIALISEAPDGMHEMKIKSLADIHLARTEPMVDTLNRLQPILLGLKMLTDHIRRNDMDWNVIAPILPILRNDLNYIAAATKLTAKSRIDTLKKH